MLQHTLNRLSPAMQQTLIYAAALAIAKGISLLLVPIATRYLSPEDYGRLDVLQTMADLLGIIIGMGLSEIMFRFAGSSDCETDQKQIAANVMGLGLVLSLVSLTLTQALAPQIAQWLPGNLTETECRIILFTLALSNLILVPLAWLRLTSQPWAYFAGTTTNIAIQAGLSALLLMNGFGVRGVLWAGLIASSLISCRLFYRQCRDTGIRFDLFRFKAFAHYGGPLVFVGMAGFVLGSFDRWILAANQGTAEVALYALAAKFGLITAVLIQPFHLWWHARRFTVLKEADGPLQCARYSEVGISMALCAAVVIAAAGPWLVYWLTPVAYHGAIVYIPWLTALAALHNITSNLAFGIMSEKHTRWPAIIDGGAAALALGAYLLMIPVWGSWGAIAATALALTSRAIATFVLSQRILPLPWRLRRLLLLAMLALLMLALMPLQPGLSALTGAALACTAILAAAWLLRLLKVPRNG